MTDEERDEGEPKVHEVSTSDGVGLGEGLIVHGTGVDSDAIRVVDSRGWTATGDVEAGATSAASATGIPSQNEDLTVETCTILVQRLNLDGATWGDPVQLDNRTGAGVDCEAQDIRDPRRRLRVQVIRAEVDPDFWRQLGRDARAELPPGTADEAALRVWVAIQRKRLHAQRDVVLALNALRTPWLALRAILEAFRQRYAGDARGIGFQAVWIVGASEAFTERLDV